MLHGSIINHNKFGEGVVTSIIENNEDALSSMVVISFGEESKKFPYFSLATFFSGVDEATLEDIKLLEEAKKEAKRQEVINRINSIKRIEVHNYDEYEHEVTKEEWEKAYIVAGEHRFPNESRAVVMDNHLGMFINASAAMRFIGGRVKECNKIYEACEKNRGSHLRHEWRYASKEDFINNCLI